MKKIIVASAVFLLLVQFVLELHLSKLDSQTTDEAVHLSAGLTYLTRFDFRFNPEHPDLVKLLAATPLLFSKLNLPPDGKYWDKAEDYFFDSWRENRAFGEELLYQLGNDAGKTLFLARLPMAALTLLLGLLIFSVAMRFWGPAGGLFATVLYVFDPIVNAHGHLITTDIAVSAGYLVAIYFFWRFLQNPRWRNVVFLAVGLGLAQLTKYTAIILYPAIFVLLIYFVLSNRQLKNFWRLLGKILVALMLTWAIIWAGYGFKMSRVPHISNFYEQVLAPNGYSNLKLLSESGAQKALNAARYILLPRDYYKGLTMVSLHATGGQDSFLLGQTSKYGWWYYFPVLFAAKTPLPTLAIIVAAAILVLTRKKTPRSSFDAGKFFLLAAALYLAFAMTSKTNLGVRHILPIYPLLFVVSGAIFAVKVRWLKVLAGLAVVVLILESVLTYPYYLSYFNIAFGGSENGYKVAADSNLDWGQDLYRIKKYLDANNFGEPFVDYAWAGETALDYYAVIRRPLSELRPDSKGYLVIGATALHNLKYDWLKSKSPYARITPSVFVYKLSP